MAKKLISCAECSHAWKLFGTRVRCRFFKAYGACVKEEFVERNTIFGGECKDFNQVKGEGVHLEKAGRNEPINYTNGPFLYGKAEEEINGTSN